MILIDTSVLVDFARKAPKLIGLIPTLPIGVCGICRAEILCGSRSAVHQQTLEAMLNSFQQVAIPESLWDQIGIHLKTLRARGVTVGFPDVVIASLGIYLDVEVWSRDQHFPLLQVVLPSLRLFQEPP